MNVSYASDTWRDAPQGRKRNTPSRAWVWVGLSAVALTGVLGCSQDGDKDSAHPSGVSAAKVCDATLDKSAAAALERIAGVDTFTELKGTNDTGDPYKFSLALASRHLHGTPSARNKCTVYKADGTSKPLIDLEFEATDNHPDPAEAAKDDDLDLYPTGLYASTRGNLAANLFFTCATKSAEGNTRYIKADMYSASDQIKPKATPKDRMEIVNSVSRALARQLGCAGEAKLPSVVPDAEKP